MINSIAIASLRAWDSNVKLWFRAQPPTHEGELVVAAGHETSLVPRPFAVSANIAFYVIFSCRPSSGPKVMDVQAIHATVRDVLQHLNTVDFEEVDRISLAFNRSFSLGHILNAVLVCGESNVCFQGGIISSCV